MYSSIISDVRKEENLVYIMVMLVVFSASYFREHAFLILGIAGVILLFEIMIRLQAILKVLRNEKDL